MSSILEETVLEAHHWTNNLFTLKVTRNPGFRFESGQFAMIGLRVDGKPLMRAYSMVNAHYDDHLEFLSIKVPNGPLTSRLQHVKPGDNILVNIKTTGTLILDNLKPGKRLYLLSTGTGMAPFLSVIKDPVAYERFEKVILVHCCRHVQELVYQDLIRHELPQNEFFGEQARDKLVYYPTVTREEFVNTGRITDLVRSGKLFSDLGLPVFDPADDRVMICGNPQMMTDLANELEERNFVMGTNAEPGDFLIEKAFAEK
jgi:ferredoxin--NADP+ reductase